LSETALGAVAQVGAILDARRAVQRRLEEPVPEALRPARVDVARQLGGLVFKGFVGAAGIERLADIERYLRAAEHRLERLPDAVATDADRMRAIGELEAEWRERGRPAEVRWMLEELRVAQFAQGIGVRGQVSSKRVRRELASYTRAP
jgi:ATP-dependent helicase HrpA